MKVLGKILIVLGILVFIPAGLNLARDLSAARTHEKSISDLDTERAAVRTKLDSVGLRLRGYQQSVPSIPDSIKKAQSGRISETYRDYNKQIRTLEMQERDLTNRMKRQRRLKSDALADTPLVSGGLGGAGLVLLVAGLALSMRGRR